MCASMCRTQTLPLPASLFGVLIALMLTMGAMVPLTAYAQQTWQVGTTLTVGVDTEAFTWNGNRFQGVGTVRRGTPVVVVDDSRNDGFVHVRTPGGWIGLVARSSFGPVPAPPVPSAGNPPTQPCVFGVNPQPGQIVTQARQGNNEITVQNQSGQIALVKLRDTSGRTAFSFFTSSSGVTRVSGVPDGFFVVSFLSAARWHVHCGVAPRPENFRPSSDASPASFETADEFRTVRQGNTVRWSHWTYTLYARHDGNARTRPMSAADFFND